MACHLTAEQQHCALVPVNTSGSSIQKLLFITKLQQPAGVVLLWGAGGGIEQANSFAQKSLQTQPGRTSILATLAISYHYEVELMKRNLLQL